MATVEEALSHVDFQYKRIVLHQKKLINRLRILQWLVVANVIIGLINLLMILGQGHLIKQLGNLFR